MVIYTSAQADYISIFAYLLMKLLLTDRMRDKAAAPVLHFGEDVARYQTGSRAAQDDVFPYQTLDVLEDALLDLKLLEHTLLKPRSFQEGITT